MAFLTPRTTPAREAAPVTTRFQYWFTPSAIRHNTPFVATACWLKRCCCVRKAINVRWYSFHFGSLGSVVRNKAFVRLISRFNSSILSVVISRFCLNLSIFPLLDSISAWFFFSEALSSVRFWINFWFSFSSWPMLFVRLSMATLDFSPLSRLRRMASSCFFTSSYRRFPNFDSLPALSSLLYSE